MYYGLDIGGTKIELAVFNEKLEKLYSERVPTPKTDYDEWLNTIVDLVNRADEKFGEISTVGLGIPGFVNQLPIFVWQIINQFYAICLRV